MVKKGNKLKRETEFLLTEKNVITNNYVKVLYPR